MLPGNFVVDCPGTAGYTPHGMHFELKSAGGPQGQRRPAAAAVVAAVLAILLLLGSLATVLAQAGGPDDTQVRESRDRVLSDSRYQTDRPEPEKPVEIEPFTFPPWLAETLYWTIIIGIGLLVVFFIGNLVLDLARNRDAFRRNREQPAEGVQRIETPLAERRSVDPHTLAQADRLAAEGRFSEAIHLLLLVAMDRLHRELGARVAPAMTGREVLRLPALPGGTVEPLTRMVALSEINHFGGRSAAEPDYRSCRADFLRFNGEEPVAA